MFRLFIGNHQCKHIVFGGCHDNGYLPTLDPYKHDTAIASRISLLETTPAQPGFIALNFKTTRFDAVFRSDPLPEKPPMSGYAAPFMPQAAIQQHIDAVTRGSSTPGSAPTSAAPQPLNSPPAAATLPQRSKTQPPPVSTSPSPSTSSGAGAATSWATVGKGGVTEKTISIAPSKKAARKYVLLNAMDQRLDEKLARPDKSATDSVNARISHEGKVCNDFHLRGVCRTLHCPYSHEPKLTPMEQLALRHKARNKLCGSYDECKSFPCLVYGQV